MTKKFYTDKDIEELFHNGVKSLQITDDVVLTDLAYEKARRLDFQLLSDGGDANAPPAAPIRPYLSEVKKPPPYKPKPFDQTQGKADSVSTVHPPLPSGEGRGEGNWDPLEKRIRDAVAARLGNQVDAALLDTIIKRTRKVIRLK